MFFPISRSIELSGALERASPDGQYKSCVSGMGWLVAGLYGIMECQFIATIMLPEFKGTAREQRIAGPKTFDLSTLKKMTTGQGRRQMMGAPNPRSPHRNTPIDSLNSAITTVRSIGIADRISIEYHKVQYFIYHTHGIGMTVAGRLPDLKEPRCLTV